MGAPLLPDDANTVCHLWVSGGALIDTKGNAWSEVGSVPRSPKADLGLGTGLQAEGVGPFSASNYFITSGVADYLNPPLATGFFVTTIFKGGLDVTPILDHIGYLIGWKMTGSGFVNAIGGTLNVPYAGDTGVARVVTAGIASGDAPFSKCDLGTTATGGIQFSNNLATMRGTGRQASLGRQLPDLGSGSFPNKIYEVLVTTTTPTASIIDALHNSLMNPDYARLMSGAQQVGADSKISARRFFGHFNLH